jgi:acyl carrier protein
MSPAPARRDVVEMLAAYRDRTPEAVGERIDSLELAWLMHQVEQRYGITLDLDDDALARMTTVSGAVEVLGEAMAGAGT